MSFACVLHFAMSSSAFHLQVFQNLHPFGFPRFSPLSVLSTDTLARACRPFRTLFREREKNVLGMGRDLPSGLGISPVDRPSNFVLFGGRLMPQRLTELTKSPFSLQPNTSSHSQPIPSNSPSRSPPFYHDRVGENRSPFGLS